MSLESFQDKDISSMIMTLTQRMCLNQRMRKDAVLDFIREHKITDSEIDEYCKNCSQIGFTFSGYMLFPANRDGYETVTNVVLSCVLFRNKNKLIHASPIVCTDWHCNKEFTYPKKHDSIFESPSKFNISKELKTCTYAGGCFYIKRKCKIRYDVFTIYNILSKYSMEFPDLKLQIVKIIQDRIKKEILKSKSDYEKSIMIQVSREILELNKDVPDPILSIFDWIDTI